MNTQQSRRRQKEGVSLVETEKKKSKKKRETAATAESNNSVQEEQRKKIRTSRPVPILVTLSKHSHFVYAYFGAHVIISKAFLVSGT